MHFLFVLEYCWFLLKTSLYNLTVFLKKMKTFNEIIIILLFNYLFMHIHIKWMIYSKTVRQTTPERAFSWGCAPLSAFSYELEYLFTSTKQATVLQYCSSGDSGNRYQFVVCIKIWHICHCLSVGSIHVELAWHNNITHEHTLPPLVCPAVRACPSLFILTLYRIDHYSFFIFSTLSCKTFSFVLG